MCSGFTLKDSGVYPQSGIDLSNNRDLEFSSPVVNVTIKNLFIVNYSRAIYCSATGNNSFLNNYILDCDFGIDLMSSGSIIKHNTFKNNTIDVSISYTIGRTNVITQNSIDSYIQVWMSDQPTIDMNYWTDYNGTDSDGDGIGDSPYFYHDILRDNHPLIEPVPVIPEFPSWIILPIFLTATLVIVFFRKFINRFSCPKLPLF